VDGRAGVFALVPSAADPTQHERVQIGTLHLVMSLEEAGPAELPAAAGGVVAAAAGPAALPRPAEAQPFAAAPLAGARSRPASPIGAVQPEAGGGERQQLGAQLPALATAAAAGLPSAGGALAAVAARGGVPAPAPLTTVPGSNTNSLVAGPEFEAAWELELWKKEEEAKWRRELKEREARRMVGAGKQFLRLPLLDNL